MTNSVADAIKRVSPLSQRPTEDVIPLHVLSDSIAVYQSCLDSVHTEAKKDGTLQKPRNCQATQSTRCSQQQEGLLQYEVPAGPWKHLGIDYFKWNQQRYLLIADYYSRFSILRSVSTMSAAHLVTVLKTIFSEYGLPEELVSDQGAQFTSEQYKSFAEEYNINITHSSPRYPQSNGFIESMVKITKQILQQCKQTSSDPHMAMLLYRATPLQSGMASPAEVLSQRRYQTTLPIKNREPVRSRNHRETMAKSGDKREEYFNKKATDYRQLQMHTNLCAARPWQDNMAECKRHWDTPRKQPEELHDPTTNQATLHQESSPPTARSWNST